MGSKFGEAFARERGGDASALDDVLQALRARARDAWRDFDVDDERFAIALARAVKAEVDCNAALSSMHVEDLYLAIACAAGNERALQSFEELHAAPLRSALLRTGVAPSVVDDALQKMRETLFVAREDHAPGIATYSGRAPLSAWLRVVGGRLARRGARHASDLPSADAEAVAEDDLELAYLKKLYGEAFDRAFRLALGALPVRDRVLLKQRLRHRLGVEQLGAMYGVHASTVSRWVNDARERLVAATRDEMMRALKIGRAEVSSILRLIRSELDITLSSAADLDARAADGDA